MALDTWDNLKLELASWLDDDGLDDQIESFIQLAEARHRRELRIRQMMLRETATLGASERYLALPTNFLQMRELRLFSNSELFTLDETSNAGVSDNYSATAARPKMFTVDGEIEFERPAASNYIAEMKFFGWVDPLSADNQTNGILTRAPDAYLWAALAVSAPWLDGDPRLEIWEAAWVSVRDALNEQDMKRGGRLVTRVKGVTP